MDKRRELKHHGILGMRWGVRRYQNKDGTLTDLGRRRLGNNPSSENIHNAVSKDYRNMNTGLTSASKGMGSAKNISERSRKMHYDRKRQQAKNAIDLSKVTDQELQAMVNRMNLERNYKNLATDDIGAGQDYLSAILATAGDVLAIGASAASIAMAVHMIKGGG